MTHHGYLPAMGTNTKQPQQFPNGLRQLRVGAGLTLDEAADRFGLSRGGYIKIENGERKLTLERISKAQQIYNVDVGQVLGQHSGSSETATQPRAEAPPQAFRYLSLSGSVSAGVFRDADVFGDHLEEMIVAPPSHRFPWARQLAFRAEGDSMNEARPQPICDGDYIVALAFEDIQGAVELKSGLNVVVRQTRDGGQSYEWTVKELALFDDRTEFLPRSSNPKHRPIVVPKDAEADDGRQVEIIGLLQYVFNNQEMAL